LMLPDGFHWLDKKPPSVKKPASVADYLAEAPDHWRPQLIQLRELMLTFGELDEAIKWAFPVYSLGKKKRGGTVSLEAVRRGMVYAGGLATRSQRSVGQCQSGQDGVPASTPF
jgi:hypothetical protein